MMALVPVPLDPPEVVLKVPTGTPPNDCPPALIPETNQLMVVLAGNAEAGVQVSTVLPTLQVGVVETKPAPPTKEAVVAPVFMGSLKVNTTVVEGETPVAPLAGFTALMMGCAHKLTGAARATNNADIEKRRPPAGAKSDFMTALRVLAPAVVTSENYGGIPANTSDRLANIVAHTSLSLKIDSLPATSVVVDVRRHSQIAHGR